MQGKRIIRGVLLVLATMFTIALSSCDGMNKYVNHNSVDSTFVAEYVNNYTNPEMFSVDEVWTLKALIEQKASIDDIFVNMSDEVIENVVTVLLKRHPGDGIYKRDVVNEYVMNRAIYDNLPTANTVNPTAHSVDRTATDLGNRPDTTVKFRVDTISNTVIKDVKNK